MDGVRGANEAGDKADDTSVQCVGFLADCSECQSSLRVSGIKSADSRP